MSTYTDIDRIKIRSKMMWCEVDKPHAEIAWYEPGPGRDALFAKPDARAPSYADQEAADGAWTEGASGLTLQHLTDDVLRQVGQPAAGLSADEADRWIVVFPAVVTPGTSKKERFTRPGRQYNAVCLNLTTGDMDICRAHVAGPGKPVQYTRFPAEHVARHFDWALKPSSTIGSAALRDKNQRDVMFVLAYGHVRCTGTLPYVPTAAYERLVRAADKSTRPVEAASAPSAAVVTEQQPKAASSVKRKRPAAAAAVTGTLITDWSIVPTAADILGHFAAKAARGDAPLAQYFGDGTQTMTQLAADPNTRSALCIAYAFCRQFAPQLLQCDPLGACGPMLPPSAVAPAEPTDV